jgi:DNA-binding IclR family transcriptional regulator
MEYLTHGVRVSSQTANVRRLGGFRLRGQTCDAVKSAIRALHVLEIFARAKRPLRAVEIGNALAVSPSSTSELLMTMVDGAYLIFDPTSKLSYPSPRLHKLGALLGGDYFGSETMDELMQSLADTIGLTTTLTTSQGSFMQLLDIATPATMSPPLKGLGVEDYIGLRLPVFRSSNGLAWLSAQDTQTVMSSVRLCSRELGRRADDVAQILERVRGVAEAGYAYGGANADGSVRGLAVPLPPARSGVVLVIGACGPSAEMDRRREDIAATLKRAATSYGGPSGHADS